MKTARYFGLLFGLAVAVIIYFIPISNISKDGHIALSLTLLTIIFWIFQVANSGFVGLLFCALSLLSGIAEPGSVFESWTKPTCWMVIVSFLLASAVNRSGLTERIADIISLRLIKSYRSLIVTIAVLQLVLSILVPNALPRSFLIYSVVKKICESANFSKKDSTALGFAVFALALPSILFFLTSDSSLNNLLLNYAVGMNIGWMEWFIHLGIPALITEAVTVLIFMILFKPSGEPFMIDRNLFALRNKERGPLTRKEWKILIWFIILILFWLTDSLHHIDISFGSMLIVVLMSFPLIGDLVTVDDWKSIPLNLLCFLTGAMAIGSVGTVTGMNKWIAATLMPSSISSNPFLLAIFISVVIMVVHIFVGSDVTVMALMIPIFLQFTAKMPINPVCVLFIIYNAIIMQYFFPFQQLTLTSGMDMAGFTNKHTIKMGIATVFMVLFMNCALCVPWWMLTGYINGQY